MSKFSYIGRSVARVDSLPKVTGQAVYSVDVTLPGMLIGKCKRSPHAFARILNIDFQKAFRLRGVRAVITAKNVSQFPFGEFAGDQLPLCDGYAYYAGDEVAAVAAVDEETALEALELIDVEYEVLEPVLDLHKALKEGAPAVHPEMKDIQRNVAYQLNFSRGEAEEGFRHADVVLEDRFSTQTMYQGYLQPRDCLAEWQGGHLNLWAVLQSPFRMRIPLARSLGMSEDQIRIIPCTVGGGFGNNAFRLWPIVALLAKAASKPVKAVLTREEDFISGRPLLSEDLYLKMGFKKDGTLVAKKLEGLSTCGAYIGSCIGVASVSVTRPDNLYHCPHLVTSAKMVYTNTIPRGSLRGYGTQILNFALESMMDRAAAELGIDPVDMRLKNAVHKGETSIHGMIFHSCALDETIRLGAEVSDLRRPRPKEGDWARGIGFGCAIHVAGNRNVVPLFDGSSATVSVDKLGKVRIISGETDIGQGNETIFVQIAAEELGVRIEDVKSMPVDTEISPFALGTFGDRVTVLGGEAVRMAAASAKRQVLRGAAKILETNPEDLDLKESEFFLKGSDKSLSNLADVALKLVFERGGLPIIGQGDYTVPQWVGFTDKKTQYGNYSIAYTFITQVAEVEVDRRTGVVEVLNVWCVVDIGQPINPKACEAQVEGGVMMGLGYALSEEYLLDRGRMINPNFHDYRLLNISKMPKIHSHFLVYPDPHTPFGAKSVGEAIGDPTAAAVANAIYDALGVRVKELPITPEKILQALERNQTRQ